MCGDNIQKFPQKLILLNKLARYFRVPEYTVTGLEGLGLPKYRDFPAELPNTLYSCSRQGVAAARLASERPGSVISISKTFPLVGVQ